MRMYYTVSFTSSNSSFTECVRTNLVIFSVPSWSNADYSGPYSAPKEVSSTARFLSCTFHSKSVSGGGGAIYFHGESSSLTVSDCLFNQCNSSSGSGGAIYCLSCGKVTVRKSSFIECSTWPSHSGAGMYTNNAFQMPEVTASIFVWCLGGEDGGTLYLYQTKGGTNGVNLPVQECRFIDCVARGDAGVYSGPDCGGLIFWPNDYTLGLCESSFVKCASKFTVGAVGLCINESRFDYVIRFCFFSDNTAPHGNNVLVEFVGASKPLWSIVFLHSFTSDTDLSKSLVSAYEDYWNPIPENTNWLPQSSTYFTNSTSGEGKNTNDLSEQA